MDKKIHIWVKSQQLYLKINKLNRLLGVKSKLIMENKLLSSETMLYPVCTSGVKLWGSASNNDLIQRYQSTTVRKITSVCLEQNYTLRLNVSTVKEEMKKTSSEDFIS